MHAGAPPEPHDILTAWNFEPFVIAPLAGVAVALYVGGRTLRRRTSGRRPARWRSAAMIGAMVALVVALVSPVDPLGESLFAGHMVQHLVLTMIAAPLLVLSDAGATLLWALSPRGRRRAGRVLRSAPVRHAWSFVSHPVSAWTLHAAALIVWHVPGPYELAVRNDAVHALEHASFLATAVLFWWVIAAPRARQRIPPGPALVYLFAAATISGILGALITVADSPWYLVHARTALAWGLTPLEDQQLAGLIMWVPAGTIYLVAIIPVCLPMLRAQPPARAATA